MTREERQKQNAAEADRMPILGAGTLRRKLMSFSVLPASKTSGASFRHVLTKGSWKQWSQDSFGSARSFGLMANE